MKRNDKPVVLVVDDIPTNVKLLKNILESDNYDVLTAVNGPMALQIAREELPELILLDVLMPYMDGYTVCLQLKQNPATQSIPVIFVTGMDDALDEAQGFAMGACDYITKPFRVPVILARVKTHLARHCECRQLEDMFRDVIEFAPDVFVLTDVQGKIVQINAQAEQMFGYERKELLGQSENFLIPSRLRSAHAGVRHHYLDQASGKTLSVSTHCLRKDGTEFPCEINLSPLQTNHGRLLMAVIRDASERHKAKRERSESRQRLRELAAQNESLREEERKHIAREVHDELGQVLTALRMDMSLLGMRHGALSLDLNDKLASMKGLVDRAIHGVRNVATNLRPSALDMGLVPAIEWLCREFTKHTSVPCYLHAQEESIALDEARHIVIFRIAQESLTNIARYAQASRVDIVLRSNDSGLWMEVRDNGCGFDLAAASTKKSFGLLGMRERAIALGGQLRINSAPDQGTVIRLSITQTEPKAETS